MGFCVNCGAELPQEAGFCPKCGTKVEVPTCPACGKEVDFDADFCLYCGARLHEPEPELVAAEPSQPEPDPAPAPVPEPPKQVNIPDHCPRCGKETVPGYEHCVYCGTYWDETVPAENQEKPAKNPGAKIAANPKDAPRRSFSWSYKRAVTRWNRQRVDMTVELDDHRLRCTDTRNLRRPAVIEEELLLKNISKITMGPRASFFGWLLVAFSICAVVALIMLPAMGFPLAVSGDDLVLSILAIGLFCTVEIWWARFNIYHYRLVVKGTEGGGQKEIVLEAVNADTLREIQVELTKLTGVQPQEPEENYASLKTISGVVVGAGIVVAIALFVITQNPNAPQTDGGSSTMTQTGGSSSETAASTTKITTSHTEPLEKEILGCWEFQYVYYYDTNKRVTELSDTPYFWFYEDYTYEFIEGDVYSAGDWSVTGDTISLEDYNDDDERTIEVNGNSFVMKKTDKEVGYQKVSSDPSYIPDDLEAYVENTYDLDFLIGNWEDNVYTMPSPASLSFEHGSDGDIDVTYVVPMADELHGTLKMDEEGDLYVDMVSIYSDNNNPKFRLYIFYDGKGLNCLQNYTDGDQYTPYFVKL